MTITSPDAAGRIADFVRAHGGGVVATNNHGGCPEVGS